LIERLVLASASPRRRRLLSLLGIPFTVIAAKVDETAREDEDARELVRRLSLAKARAVAQTHGLECPIVAADTVVVLDSEVLGKPADPAEALNMLRRLRGREHLVLSGVAVLDPASGRVASELAESVVWLRPYGEEELARYVASGDPLDKAGAYAIQHRDFSPVERVEGCYASVMGLPLCHLVRALRRLGLTPPTDVPRACQEFTGHACSLAEEILAP